MQLSIKKMAVAGAVAALCLGASSAANAQVTFDGVTFTTSFSGNVLTLEIDAAGHSGGWASATTIGDLQIKGIGDFSSVVFTGPGAASGWTVNAGELDAGGCGSPFHVGKAVCASGAHVPLTDDMIFTYTFTGSPNLSDPHVKVAFYNGDGDKKVGSLLSVDVPAVPEPGEYALLLAGLGVLGVAARRRKA
ncbi:MAG: PEP-CTERM sorting domain-containing protein [Telluria sp.]